MNLRKGNAHVKEWMEEHCKVQMTSTDAGTFKMKHALSEYCKYISGRKGAGDGTVQLDELVVSGLSHLQLSYFGFRYTVCCVDATVWPSDAQYVAECLDLVNNVCSMGQTNVGHVQVPLYHSGTTVSALLKHRRKLEDCLLKADMDITNTLTGLCEREREGNHGQTADHPTGDYPLCWEDLQVDGIRGAPELCCGPATASPGQRDAGVRPRGWCAARCRGALGTEA